MKYTMDHQRKCKYNHKLPLIGLAILALCLVPCFGVFVPGKCPTNRSVVQNFDIKRYSGTWYEYLRKNESYIFLGDCNAVTYTANDNKTIGIKSYRLLPDPVREEHEETYAVFSDPQQSPLEGRWNISYRWNDPYFENHRIMETDYETYSITYICLPAGPEYSTDEFVIYTREPQVPWQLQRRLIETVGQHYNLSLLIRPRQQDCPHRNAVRMGELAAGEEGYGNRVMGSGKEESKWNWSH